LNRNLRIVDRIVKIINYFLVFYLILLHTNIKEKIFTTLKDANPLTQRFLWVSRLALFCCYFRFQFCVWMVANYYFSQNSATLHHPNTPKKNYISSFFFRNVKRKINILNLMFLKWLTINFMIESALIKSIQIENLLQWYC
jgi:hypothetical protein